MVEVVVSQAWLALFALFKRSQFLPEEDELGLGRRDSDVEVVA